MPQNRVTVAMRTDIFDWLTMSSHHWAGDQEEPDFLSRLFDLRSMPSTDGRPQYPTAAEDIWQHRVNNRTDWDDNWVFGDKGTGRYLLKFRWTAIRRHPLVRGRSSPDDPALREYWWSRQRVNARYLSESDLNLAIAQDWVCPVCGMDLINGEELHRHHKQPKESGGADGSSNRTLVHLYCHQQIHSGRSKRPR